MSKIAFIEESTVTVDEYGCIRPAFLFGDFKPVTSGYLKYLPLKKGTRVKVRLEVYEEGCDE